jgi:hypothetical protein
VSSGSSRKIIHPKRALAAVANEAMSITFREAVAEVELGLVSGDQLSDIATAGLLEGYESPSLATLAGQFGEPYDPIVAERLWAAALAELNITSESRTSAARVLVRAYARQVAEGDVPPQLGASKIAGLHRLTAHAGCDGPRPGDCIGVAGILALFYAHDGRGYLNPTEFERINGAIMDECQRLAVEQLA